MCTPTRPSTLATVAVTLLASTLLLQSTTPVTRLDPVRSFDIPASMPVDLRTFAANSTGLYFLLKGHGYAEIIHLATSGELQNRVLLPFSDASSLVVGEDGNMVVLKEHHGSMVELDAKGILNREIPLDRHVTNMVFVGGALVGFTGSTVSSEPNHTSLLGLSAPVSQPYLVAAASPHSIAVVQSASGNLVLADLSAHTASTRVLYAPEIQAVSRNSSAVAVASIAISESGDIFCAISPYHSDAAIVLRFNSLGTLKARFRCRLPTFAELKGHPTPDGNMLAGAIGVSGTLLLIVSQAELKCATYNIPK